MQALRQLGGGLLLGLLSVIIVFGGMSLALAEGYVPQPPATLTETQPTPPSTVTVGASLLPFVSTSTETVTASPVPSTFCPIPPGWFLAPILPGDTLETLALRYRTTSAELMRGNCLVSPTILPGYGIYVPALPTATYVPCGAPFGWVRYTVQPGDNLFRISLRYGITVTQLMQANCLTSDFISAGQQLWVPYTITSTPSATPISIEFSTETPTSTETSMPEPTSTELPPSETPEPTETPAPTETPPPPTP